jgi:Ca2+-binding EF-hand superfamily protein
VRLQKEESGDNLNEKVDLTRVRDARRAFRRKYAARNNVDKIFDKYDVGQKGYITADDLFI